MLSGRFCILDLESVEDAGFGAKQLDRIRALVGPATVATPDHLGPLGDADRILVTGSGAMVADTTWARPVAQPVEDAARGGAQVLAICFGHQLMAWHFGGRLASFDRVMRAVRPVTFEAVGPFAAETIDLLHSHRDHVVEPGAMIQCGTGGVGGIAALRHPDLPIWSCQGHPEWTKQLALGISDDWLEPPRDTPGTADIVRRFATA